MEFAGSVFLIIQIAFLILLETHSAKTHKDSLLDTDMETSEDTTPNRDFRWSYFYFLEKKCTNHCQKRGKPFGRLEGGLCRCYCPIIAPDWTLCGGTTPSCDNFCRAIKYQLGGGCIYEPGDCYCFCTPMEFYNASLVYSLPNSTSSKPSVLTELKPVITHVINKPIIISNNTVTGSGNLTNTVVSHPVLSPVTPKPVFPKPQGLSNPITTASVPSLQATNGNGVVVATSDDEKNIIASSSVSINETVVETSPTSTVNGNGNLTNTVVSHPVLSLVTPKPVFPKPQGLSNPITMASVPSLLATSGNGVVAATSDDEKNIIASSTSINETVVETPSTSTANDSSIINVSNEDYDSEDASSHSSSNIMSIISNPECPDCTAEEIPSDNKDESNQTDDIIENMNNFDDIMYYDGYDFDTAVNEFSEGEDVILAEYFSEYYDPISRRGILTDKD